MFRKILLLILTLVIVLPVGWTAFAQSNTGTLISNLNIRTGPGTEYSTITTLSRGETVNIIARNNVGDWVLVQTQGGTVIRGWAASRYLIWGDGADLGALPVQEDLILGGAGLGMADVPMADPGGDAGETGLQTLTNTYFRQGPDTGFPSMSLVPTRTALQPEARSEDGEWILARNVTGEFRGWVLKNHTAASIDVNALPVSSEVLGYQQVYDSFRTRLEATPIMPTITERARQIFQAGQVNGQNSRAFSKIGDCHTDHEGFFLPFGVDEYNLGPYQDLQSTIDFFNVAPRHGVSDSFENDSKGAESAFTAAAVQDPVWSDPIECQQGESPLECEYRLTNPGVALILLGSVDMQIYEVQDYAFHMRHVIEDTMNQGIVPVLITIPSNHKYLWNKSLQFNAMLLDLAAEYQLPVVNFWLAMQDLPNSGLEDDNFHLSYDETRQINFDGEENNWGVTLRNLIALQALQVLQQQLLQ